MTRPPPLWSPDVPLPESAALPLPDRIEHLVIHRSRVPWQFAHEAALCVHCGSLYVAWNACPRAENEKGAVVRWMRSQDGGYTWSEPLLLAGPLRADDTIWESCQLLAHGGHLWAFVGQAHPQPRTPEETGGRMAILRLNETDNAWEQVGGVEGFQPLNRPQRLPGGVLLMGGQFNLSQPRVARCVGDDPTRWEVFEIPYHDGDRIRFAETALICAGDEITACIRSAAPTLYVAASADGGRTWSALEPSNLPAVDSKTCAGILSTGQHYLVYNLRPARFGSLMRDVLVMALSAPGRMPLCKTVLIRSGTAPRARQPGFAKEEQWSYPAVEELDGRVYVAYSITKEDIGLSILPLEALIV
ncbi:MAG: exo-alpha-sialidase [Chloroflexi bacterium]|nr:exo-alpha-sialidase [Chloroflexota bacterium]